MNTEQSKEEDSNQQSNIGEDELEDILDSKKTY
jgi:hypothetical protein